MLAYLAVVFFGGVAIWWVTYGFEWVCNLTSKRK